MTPKEWTDKTVRDLQRRKDIKAKGESDALAFTIERAIRKKEKRDKAKNRGVFM